MSVDFTLIFWSILWKLFVLLFTSGEDGGAYPAKSNQPDHIANLPVRYVVTLNQLWVTLLDQKNTCTVYPGLRNPNIMIKKKKSNMHLKVGMTIIITLYKLFVLKYPFSLFLVE